jgi:hypothetical protein
MSCIAPRTTAAIPGECLALAQQATTPHDRARLLEMAHAFNELAIEDGEASTAGGE